MATVAARSVMRLTAETSRIAAIRISAGVKAKAAPSPFRVSSRTPLTARIFRTPVELSGVSLLSMLPYHTATASALLKSKLSVAPHGHAWTLEGKERTRYEGHEKEVN
ncbi:protein NUCLEAR FUSION DEFECTIVE 6, mitochondrial-like isoform X1 [Primulina eburnea]|uniref:protein NUCLEAR FUSION DEFECTIVE 6, mitochondrial-like isoform X1 n=1 Tax=Primulina eburnea TaxID=1245227 RepID=UPI003C6C8739